MKKKQNQIAEFFIYVWYILLICYICFYLFCGYMIWQRFNNNRNILVKCFFLLLHRFFFFLFVFVLIIIFSWIIDFCYWSRYGYSRYCTSTYCANFQLSKLSIKNIIEFKKEEEIHQIQWNWIIIRKAYWILLLFFFLFVLLCTASI